MAVLLRSKGTTQTKKPVTAVRIPLSLAAQWANKPRAHKGVYLVAVLVGAVARALATAWAQYQVPARQARPLFGSKVLAGKAAPGRPTALLMKPA